MDHTAACLIVKQHQHLACEHHAAVLADGDSWKVFHATMIEEPSAYCKGMASCKQTHCLKKSCLHGLECLCMLLLNMFQLAFDMLKLTKYVIAVVSQAQLFLQQVLLILKVPVDSSSRQCVISGLDMHRTLFNQVQA